MGKFTEMSTGQDRSVIFYEKKKNHFLRDLLYKRNYSLVVKLSHFLILSILVIYLERKHLKIKKCRSQCLKRQRSVDKIHIMN